MSDETQTATTAASSASIEPAEVSFRQAMMAKGAGAKAVDLWVNWYWGRIQAASKRRKKKSRK